MLTDRVALWMMETLALLPLGMPKESFTIILDGGEAPEKCSDIFEQIVQRDAVWQAAWETVAANELAEESFLDKRLHNCYRMDGFPEAMRDMENNLHGFIQCAFDLRPSIWDVEKETEKFRHLTLEESNALPVINQMFFQPPEPLPTWQDLLAENILPEFFGEQEVVESEFNYEWHLIETDDEEIEDDESQPDLKLYVFQPRRPHFRL
ncbi:hypothetical protein TGAMA5MH_02050 [Trichoderma gamsii]|uniref:Uncharacterized protein n=1 Tax=Trichoderma gamsii TaxID=398673 RepID=A0A2K0TM39_9HYPO|nr:hypothetical protein TGAMA5MH_02050 [Trichoderma gamsii]